MPTHKTICVYASSANTLDEVYFRAAADLGRLMADHRFDLVYGGGNVGLMGAVARAVHGGGARVISVIPERLMVQHFPESHETIVTQDLRERKRIMEARADAFVALPGGFGTLDETLEIIALKQLDFHRKPVVLLNTQGCYDPLVALFESLYERKFAGAGFRELYHVARTPKAALDYIAAYIPAAPPQKVPGG